MDRRTESGSNAAAVMHSASHIPLIIGQRIRPRLTTRSYKSWFADHDLGVKYLGRSVTASQANSSVERTRLPRWGPVTPRPCCNQWYWKRGRKGSKHLHSSRQPFILGLSLRVSMQGMASKWRGWSVSMAQDQGCSSCSCSHAGRDE